MVTLMRFNIFLVFILIFAYLIYNIYISVKKDDLALFNYFLNTGLFLSILLVVSLTIFPVTTQLFTPPEFNIVPFKTILNFINHKDFIEFLANVIGNIILFTPLGFFLYIKLNENYKKSFLICLCATIFVECVQIFLPMRTTDIDDIILNTLGSVIGILIAKIITSIIIPKTIQNK